MLFFFGSDLVQQLVIVSKILLLNSQQLKTFYTCSKVKIMVYDGLLKSTIENLTQLIYSIHYNYELELEISQLYLLVSLGLNRNTFCQ